MMDMMLMILTSVQEMPWDVRNGNDDIESNGRRFQETSSEVAATMRSLIEA